MKTRWAAVGAGALFLLLGVSASAHRLDEYLQATTISLEKDHVQAQIHLTPGVAVFPFVLAGIDTNGDGAIATAEQRAYAERVLKDLSLAVDGESLPLRLVSSKFAAIAEMKEERGDIELDLTADVPRAARNRELRFENHHQSRIAVYLVNCLVPSDPDIRVTAQTRNYEQSTYRLDYVQAGTSSPRSDNRVWLGLTALLLFTPLALRLRQRASTSIASVASGRSSAGQASRTTSPPDSEEAGLDAEEPW